MIRIIFTLLFLLSLPVHAKSDSPIGLYQVDSSNSHAILSDGQRNLSGHIDIKEVFPDSKFVFESGDGLFHSTEVTGDLNSFKLKGIVTVHGNDPKEVEFEGTGSKIHDEADGFDKIILKLSSKECTSNVFVTKPKVATAELYRSVREIIR